MQTIGIDYDEKYLRCGRIQNTDKPEFVKLKQFSADNKGIKSMESWLGECGDDHSDIVIGITVSDVIGASLAYRLSKQGYTIAPLTGWSVFQAYLESRKRRQPAEVAATLAITKRQTYTPLSEACLQLRSELFEREITRVNLQQNEAHNEKFTGQAFDFLMQLTANAMNKHEEHLEETDRKIADLISTNPEFKRDFDLLKTIPGMDDLAAQSLVFFAHAYPAEDAHHFASCLGLDDGSKLDQSDYRVHDLRVVRGPLYSAAKTALEQIPAIRAFGERLSQKGKAENVITVAAMHKLARMAYAVIHSKQAYREA